MSAMPNTSRFLASLMALVFVALLGGCANNDDLESDANAAERQIYSEAQKYLKSKNFDLAIKTLQRLESRYPFGKYAEQAQLEIIYAHYGAYQPEAAIEAADRFIRLHPQHPSIDYAYYMKGLAAHSGNNNIFARFLPTLNRRVIPVTSSKLSPSSPNCWLAFQIQVTHQTRGPEWFTSGTCWHDTKSTSLITISDAVPIWQPSIADGSS